MKKLTTIVIIVSSSILPVLVACTPGPNASPESPSSLPSATSTYSVPLQDPSEEVIEGENLNMSEGVIPPADFLLSFIGLTVSQAEEKAKEQGYTVRVISVDNEPRSVTMDYSPKRFNVEIVKDKIVRVTTG